MPVIKSKQAENTMSRETEEALAVATEKPKKTKGKQVEPEPVKPAVDRILEQEAAVVEERRRKFETLKEPALTSLLRWLEWVNSGENSVGPEIDLQIESEQLKGQIMEQLKSLRQEIGMLRKRPEIVPIRMAAVGELVQELCSGDRMQVVAKNDGETTVIRRGEQVRIAPGLEVQIVSGGVVPILAAATTGGVGGRASHKIFDQSHTKFAMWAGYQVDPLWTTTDVQAVYRHFGLPEISEQSIKTFMYAGRAERKALGSSGRGDLPTYSPEQVDQLYKACGK